MATKEVGRLREEVSYKNEFDLNYEDKLFNALGRYNPANMFGPPK